jgi:hypothetical protein
LYLLDSKQAPESVWLIVIFLDLVLSFGYLLQIIFSITAPHSAGSPPMFMASTAARALIKSHFEDVRYDWGSDFGGLEVVSWFIRLRHINLRRWCNFPRQKFFTLLKVRDIISNQH